MTFVRRNLKLTEISVCKSPANPLARIALFKSAETNKESNMPKFDKSKLDDDGQKFVTDLEKSADDTRTENDTLKAEATKKDEEIEALKAKVAKPEDELDENGKKKKKPNPFGKEALPEDAREYVEGIEKAAKDAAAETDELKKKNENQEKRIAKMEDETLTKAMGDFVDTVSFAVAKDDRDAEIEVLKSLEGDALERYQKGLQRQHEGMKASKVFAEIGTGGDGEGATAHDQTTAKAVEIRKADPKLTKEQAYARALDENPELYAEHRAEQTPAN